MELREKAKKLRLMIEQLVRYIDPNWKCNRSEPILNQLAVGITSLSALFSVENIDDERIVDYCVYQIYRSRQSIEDKKWKISWLFSGHAEAKYRQQFMTIDGKSGINYYIDIWLDDNGTSRKKLSAMIADEVPSKFENLLYMPAEEAIKKRWLNTPEGLALCAQYTTGWSPFSATCTECQNNGECEKITSKKYPALTEMRRERWENK